MNFPLNTDLVENVTFDEITLGQSARLLRTLSGRYDQAARAASSI